MQKNFYAIHTWQLFNYVILAIVVTLVFQNCVKEKGNPNGDRPSSAVEGKKKPPSNPPTPLPFYFNGCSNTATIPHFVAGKSSNIIFTMTYVNSPGGAYPAFTSATVNGITVTAPAGNLNIGSGSITFTATGTPINPGIHQVPMSIGGSISCALYLTTINAPAPLGANSDPGPAYGSTGFVTFNYRGQQVTYFTVRAKDGKVWTQQNLGSPQVAWSAYDETSFGHYFQWGRWDDGHQVRNSSSLLFNSSLQNPSHIPSGNMHFISGDQNNYGWWSNGNAGDTWSDATISSTNGKDPCTALGPGWHMPTISDWQNIMNTEGLSGELEAFNSTLKLPASGYRAAQGGYVYSIGAGGYYWSSGALANGNANAQFFDNNYNAMLVGAPRGSGVPCRCVK